jgi:WD40 repeat protein
LILLLLLLSCSVLVAEIPVSLGHFGKINDLLYDRERELLFSAGEDGTVRVWNSDERLEQVVRISHKPLRQLAVHPSEPHVAVLVGDGVQTDTLEVWNWRHRKRLFTIQSDKELLHFAYSPKGSYLFYSRADFKSLTAVNPRTGRVLPYMGRGFGIVSYFTVARNEGNIMTYQPSGAITYWDIRTGRMVKQIKAPTDLEVIRISPNNRYIAASTGQDLLIVDILSGETIDSTRVESIVDLGFAPGGNEITGVVEDQDGRVLKKWYFGGRYLIAIATPHEKRFVQPSCVVHSDGRQYVGTSEGRIASIASGGEISVIARDNRREISDLAFFESALAIATVAEIVIIDSDFFLDAYEEDRDVEVRELHFPNPFECTVGITYLDAQRLLVWCNEVEVGTSTGGGLAVLNTWYGGFQELPVPLESAIRQVWVSEQGIVVVEQSGRCRILDPHSFAVTFEYNAPGMNKLILTFSDTLIGAKTQLSAFSGPLMQINRRTGETVPIQDPSLFVYDLYYSGSSRGGQLYTLAVEQHAQKVRTVVKAHSGFAFERSKVLSTFEGEDLGASITGDDAGTVFTSLGYESITRIQGSGISLLEASGQIPRKLTAHNTKLFSLNRDASISVWDISSGRILSNIHFFQDGTWVALSPAGTIRLSREGGLYSP